ncbi:low affinity potassium transporter [Serendipita sp. 397]|nr:low affinity potassium transporter [Serendipita sp. 397]
MEKSEKQMSQVGVTRVSTAISNGDDIMDPATTTGVVLESNENEEGVIVVADLGPPSTNPWIAWLEKHLNFFRIHLLVFTFFPLICSVVFWAVNGQYKIAYIDAVLVCYSAFTNTGLSSIDLSRTTPLQQAMLFIQMFFGSIIVVAWVVVLVRKNIMARHCAHWVAQRRGFGATARNAMAAVRRKTMGDIPTKSDANKEEKGFPSFRSEPLPTTGPHVRPKKRQSTGAITPFRKQSTRKLSGELQRVDPSGRISREPSVLDPIWEAHTDRARTGTKQASAAPDAADPYRSFLDTIPATPAANGEEEILTASPKPFMESPRNMQLDLPVDDPSQSIERPTALDDGGYNDEVKPGQIVEPPTDRKSEQKQDTVPVSPRVQRLMTSPLPVDQTFLNSPPASATAGGAAGTQGGTPIVATPRTVGFNVPVSPRETGSAAAPSTPSGIRQRRTGRANGTNPERQFTYSEIDVRRRNKPLNRTQSYKMPKVDPRFVTKTSIGFGGFPGPIAILRRVFRAISHRWGSSRFGKVLKPYPSLLLPAGAARPEQLERYDTKEVPYFSFSAVVGKNSAFHGLTERELYELGGVEYRALSLLSTLVPAYYIFFQALSWAVMASLFAKPKYDTLFLSQWRIVQPPWAGVFMGTSALTNTGMSLVDTALIPFQDEFGVLIMTSINSLAGNTAFPILWIGTKVRSDSSETWATLHFLLDHPRRCFLYLFPSHQTWLLLIIIFGLNMIDWAGFMLFDLGNHVLESIPLNQRVINGFLQATSVRCAGVASVSLSLVAPATQVLFVIMMYIAPYPIALALRSTNVYQDRSLGVYEEEEDSDEEEEKEEELAKEHKSRPSVWGSYLAWHAKRQLAYDVWWLVAAWLLVAIFERSKIWDLPTRQFDLFGILFELVSAYSSVGLSLGLSNANYSLCGAWSVPSKLVLVLVMIRGRSRGLPVAIDRSVMIPREMTEIAKRQKPIRKGDNLPQDPRRLDTIHEKEP